MRQPDVAYESLAQATNADMEGSRGELNRALKLIRDQTDAIGEHLASEIRTRAQMYRQQMPDVMLTPTALAKHWLRLEDAAARQPHATNRSSQTTDCPTCGGDRMVVVYTRPVVASAWMVEKGIKPPAGAAIEEYAPCPDCNANTDASYWAQGRKIEGPDPEQVRRLIGQG